MARGDDKGSDKGKVKVRVIEFEMEGSNQTLRDSIRDIVGAIGRTPQVVRLPRAPALPITKGNGELDVDEESVIDGDKLDVEDDVGSSEEEETGSRQRRQRSVPRTPNLLDLDLRSGNRPLKEFLEKLAPESVIERYVTIAYWLKHHLQIEEV